MMYLIHRYRTLLYLTCILSLMSLTGCGNMIANDGAKKEWLFVHTANDGLVKSPTTIVMPAERDIFAFSDRPYRELVYLTPRQYVSLWSTNADKGSFTTDPPNAVITWTNALNRKIREAEVILTNAITKDQNIIYTYKCNSDCPYPTKLNWKGMNMQKVSVFVDGSSNNDPNFGPRTPCSSWYNQNVKAACCNSDISEPSYLCVLDSAKDKNYRKKLGY